MKQVFPALKQVLPARNRQSGVVLFVALMMLVILSLIGVTVARMQTVEERMARNDNNHQLAHQAAEAALRYGESLLQTANSSQFGANAGGYYQVSSTGSLIPGGINWNVPANVITYAGAPLTLVPTAVQTPRLVLELVGYGSIPGDTLGSASPTPVYRVTAQGLNADGTPSVILQSIYR